MISSLYRIDGKGVNPYQNIAMEKYLLTHVEAEECILYLWQNQKTVVIGRNQNAWKECRIGELEVDGGHLVRRLSGGGAVFHDLGNLNFTFLVRKDNYDVRKQTEVILQAVQSFGILAERTGRNDITIEGKKFSGNAFYSTGDFCYHHGTLLLDVDKADMSRYLNVPKEKLQSKGVDSVKSRVTNLTDFIPGVTEALMKERMTAGFASVYGLPVKDFPVERLNQEEVSALTERFASWEWNYGRKISFTDEHCRRFSWGGAEIQVKIEDGRIGAAKISSDALDTELIGKIEAVLLETMWSRKSVTEVLVSLLCESELQKIMKQDIEGLIYEMI